jgi:hypothetical protein
MGIIAIILIGIAAVFALTLIIVLIVKIANYVNGKGFTSERKSARKLLGIELAILLLWCVVAYASTYVSLG